LTLENEEISSIDLQTLEAFNLYNATALKAGLPQAAKLTETRKRGIKARLKDYGAPKPSGLEAWKIALQNLERSAYLQGNGGGRQGWRADLDFLIQPSRFTKVVEGGYGNGAHAGDGPETRTERIARVVQELEREQQEKQP
jgi:hypothetical protein